MRNGNTKNDIIEFAKKYYNMNFSLDEIRGQYRFDVSCQGSVPQAIKAFLEGNSFEEGISLAISIGGDSDTIAAIAGSISEIMYPISNEILTYVKGKLDAYLIDSINESTTIILNRETFN